MLTMLLRLLGRLPLLILHGMSVPLSILVWLLDKRYRSRLMQNLCQAYQYPLTANRLENKKQSYAYWLWGSIIQHGKGALELLAAWVQPTAVVLRWVRRCEGWQHVETAITEKRAIIFITPHLGGFDVAGRYVNSRLPYPLTAMYKPPKQAWLEPLMQAGRMRDNGVTVPATMSGVRQLIKTLKNGGATMILPDQVPSAGDGVWAPFFGKQAYTMTLPARLAMTTDAVVLFFFAERLRFGRGFIVHLTPMQGVFTGDKINDALTLNSNIEQLIMQAPTQYLWSYNRYKKPSDSSLLNVSIENAKATKEKELTK